MGRSSQSNWLFWLWGLLLLYSLLGLVRGEDQRLVFMRILIGSQFMQRTHQRSNSPVVHIHTKNLNKIFTKRALLVRNCLSRHDFGRDWSRSLFDWNGRWSLLLPIRPRRQLTQMVSYVDWRVVRGLRPRRRDLIILSRLLLFMTREHPVRRISRISGLPRLPLRLAS